jgi:ribosomal protein S18 acetylase RimI-like enzyme
MWTIRPFESRDVDALYAISLATGHLGDDAARLYKDPKLMGHLYAGAYAALEPVLVLSDGNGVAGFAVGVLDTVTWERRLQREWWPQLRQHYPNPSATPQVEWTPDERRAHLIHHPRETPLEVAHGFAAHLHMNLLPRAQGIGQGTQLLDRWLRLSKSLGGRAVHVGANRGNHRAVAFWRRRGFEPLLEQNSTAWLGRQMDLFAP